MILFSDLCLYLSLGLNSCSFALGKPFALFGLSFLFCKVDKLVLGFFQLLLELIKLLLLLILLSQLCPELHPWHPQ
jgi:hypothetical protein